MEITEEYLNTYFGKNSGHYIDIWKEYKSGKVISFKAYAFLFGIFWFLYRKMYGLVVVIIFVILGEGMIEEYLLTDILNITEDKRKIFDFVLPFLFATCCGMFGNFLYMNNSERKIGKILSMDLSEEEKLKKLKVSGGTSWLFLVIIGLIIAIIVAINNFIE